MAASLVVSSVNSVDRMSRTWFSVARNFVPLTNAPFKTTRTYASHAELLQRRRHGSAPAGPCGRSVVEIISKKRVLFVAGTSTSGRASVAAAAALALGRRQRQTLLVDADDPGHGMADLLGIDMHAGRPSPVIVTGRSPPGIIRPDHLVTARLSAPDAQQLMEQLMDADRWKSMLEEDSTVKLAESFGIPMSDLVAVVDCFRPPPGAEMPVALANLLQERAAAKAQHVVVDAGAPTAAAQLGSVPPAVAKGLDGFLGLKQLFQKAKQPALPSAVAYGMRLMIGDVKDQGWSVQFSKTIAGLERLRVAMRGLADEEKAVMLVLPYRPGGVYVESVRRTITRLRPSCIILTVDNSETLEAADLRPEWLPPELVVLTVPWSKEWPAGIAEISNLADAMCKE